MLVDNPTLSQTASMASPLGPITILAMAFDQEIAPGMNSLQWNKPQVQSH